MEIDEQRIIEATNAIGQRVTDYFNQELTNSGLRNGDQFITMAQVASHFMAMVILNLAANDAAINRVLMMIENINQNAIKIAHCNAVTSNVDENGINLLEAIMVDSNR